MTQIDLQKPQSLPKGFQIEDEDTLLCSFLQDSFMDPIRTSQSYPTLGEHTAKASSESLAGPSTTFHQESFLTAKLVRNGGEIQSVSSIYQVSQEHHETKMICAGVPAEVSLRNVSHNIEWNLSINPNIGS